MTPEDEAFEEIERRQGGGFKAKQAMAADKLQEPEREALKLALEALKANVIGTSGRMLKTHEALRLCEEALAQPAQEPVACIVKGHLYMAHEFMSGIPEGATLLYTTPTLPVQPDHLPDAGKMVQPAQEPVAWITPDGEGFRIRFSAPTNDVPLGWDALFTTQPKREWVGLTEENFSAINQSCLTKLQAATSAESILRERNT